MSVETMSTGSAIAAATEVSTSSAISSFGGEFSGGINPNLGGSQISGFDNAAFSETFQMAAPLESFFATDKISPNVSPFENTQVIWQAPTTPTVAAIDFDAELSQIQEANLTPITNNSATEIQLDLQPEVISIPLIEHSFDIDTKANSFIQEMSNTELTAPEIAREIQPETGPQVSPINIVQQEITADEKQAIKVEEALILIGNKPKVAHEIALRTLTQTLGRKEIHTQPPPTDAGKRNLVFEHDAKADEARKKAAAIAIEEISRGIDVPENKVVTGHDLAERMPNPQPQDIKSEIVKKHDDGSYESLIKQLENTGEIYSAEEAEKIVEKLIVENHAVRSTDAQTSHAATTAEVEKVLKSGTIFENKI